MTRPWNLALFLVVLGERKLPQSGTAAFMLPSHPSVSRSHSHSTTNLYGEQEDNYLRALREAAKDPVLFEKFVAQQADAKLRLDDDPNDNTNPTDSSSSRTKRTQSREDSESTTSRTLDTGGGSKKSGYTRVEDWDRERKERGIMTQDERMQFEAQRQGNGVKQNDILRRNLHS